jgi:molecular chaperone DnaK (HSP70)
MKTEMCESTFYLVVRQKNFWNLAARLVSKQPKLAAGEVAMSLTVKLPTSMFKKPTLRATVEVPESAIVPAEIDCAVLDNVREAIEAQTGMKVEVAVVTPEAAQ